MEIAVKAKSAHLIKDESLVQNSEKLYTAGGEPNVLVGVKVNGTALAIAEKMVDILYFATGGRAEQ